MQKDWWQARALLANGAQGTVLPHESEEYGRGCCCSGSGARCIDPWILPFLIEQAPYAFESPVSLSGL